MSNNDATVQENEVRPQRTNYFDVGSFHCKFNLPFVSVTRPPTPTLLDGDTYDFRVNFLFEELHEFTTSHRAGDLAKAADALIDLVYVAMGTAQMMQLPWQELWNEVQRANMAKQRAINPSESKRGSALDVIKPPGWTPPNIEGILAKYLR